MNRARTFTPEQLREIIAAHGRWLSSDPTGVRADLSGAELSRADLSGANLSRAELSWAELSGANLSRAELSRARLSRADLSGAELSGAELSRANLSGANLSGADLSRAELSWADLSGADLSGANLSRANLSRANLSRANLSRANLSGAAVGAVVLPASLVVIAPLGSRGDRLIVQRNEDGSLTCTTGCFRDSVEAFLAAVAAQHGDNEHGRAYRTAVAFARERLAVPAVPQDQEPAQ